MKEILQTVMTLPAFMQVLIAVIFAGIIFALVKKVIKIGMFLVILAAIILAALYFSK